jgi:hypothetical protein
MTISRGTPTPGKCLLVEKTVAVLSADYLSMNWAFPLNKKTQAEIQKCEKERKRHNGVEDRDGLDSCLGRRRYDEQREEEKIEEQPSLNTADLKTSLSQISIS